MDDEIDYGDDSICCGTCECCDRGTCQNPESTYFEDFVEDDNWCFQYKG